jgi:serine/threonine-protein kinase RsbW
MDPAPSDQVSTFSLELPSDPTMLSSARLFAAAVAREAGCAEALLDDIKLAVSEACTEAIRRTVAHDGTISLRADIDERFVTFETAGPAADALPPEDDLDHFSLVAALFDGAERRETPGGASISFSVPLV